LTLDFKDFRISDNRLSEFQVFDDIIYPLIELLPGFLKPGGVFKF
jgi:hypothetical protein